MRAPPQKSEQPSARNLVSSEVYLFTQKHGLTERRSHHFSDDVRLPGMDWRVINKMPLQGAVENAEILYEVLWKEIGTEQSQFQLHKYGIWAVFTSEFRRTYRENTNSKLVSCH